MKIFKAPFFIAEMSANHNGSFEHAKKLIKTAKVNGADAIKLQTFTPDTMTLKSDKKYFKVNKGLWKNKKLWDLYNEAKTPLEWHKPLFDYAKKLKLTIFSTPFDETAVDFLEKLQCPIYKVASFEMTDISLIKKIALTKKPMIISTGMATMKEIEKTFKVAKDNGANDITLLYCVSNYPSKVSDFNLNNIKILKDKFKCRVGLSDHSLDNTVAMSAIAAGAEVIEKHIGLDNQKTGLDIKFSLKGKEIKLFSKTIKDTHKLLGKKYFFRSDTEKDSLIFRRSIFAVKKISKGEKFSIENIKKIRPGYGISPSNYEKLIGKKSKRNYNAGDPIKKNF